MTVFCLWIVDTDDLYPDESVLAGVFRTRLGAEKHAADNPLNKYSHSEYDITEIPVRDE